MRDLRIAARGLLRTPGFTVAAVLTLALGIGAATGVFSVAYSIMLAPLPIRDANHVVVMWGYNPNKQPEHFPLSGAEYAAFARDSRSFVRIAAIDYHATLPRLVQFGDTAATVNAAMVTGDLFQVLGAQPLAGRLLRPEDDAYGAPLTAVLSEGLWKRAYGADPTVVGHTTKIYGRDIMIVGVVAGALDYPHGAEMWASYPAFWPAKDSLNGFYDVVARLKPGVTPRDAANELGAFLKRADVPHSGARRLLGDMLRPVAMPLMDVIVGDVRPAIRVVSAAVAMLLLVTCINIANLLLLRTVMRRRELAVRAALGAGRGRIARQVFAESALLSLMGGLLGIGFAWGAVRVFVLGAPANLPRATEIAMSGPALVAAVVMSIVVTLLFGMLPAITGGRFSLADSLRERRTGESSPTAHRSRTMLVGVQVAVAVSVLVGAGVVARGFEALAHADLGFDADKLIMARLGALPPFDFSEFPAAAEAVLERVRALPGVTHATAVLGRPFQPTGNDLAYSLPGDTPNAPTNRPLADYLAADADYFRTLGIALRKGRTFTAADRKGAPLVAVVDELLARQAWPGEDPIGKSIGVGTRFHTVVGVVASTRYRDVLAPRATLYASYAQSGLVASYAVVRTTGDPATLMPALRAAVREADPRFFLADMGTLDQRVDETLAQAKLDALLLTGFAVGILLLTGVGLYSVAAAFVRHREFELGVRLALGATPSEIVRVVLRQGLAVIAFGAIAGLVIATLGAGALSALVFEGSTRDPVAFIAAIGLVAAVAGLALLIPARRASHANPADVLRTG